MPNPSDIFHHLNPVMDPILQRRPYEWYLGKVMLLKGSAVPQGYPEGYFILLSYDRKQDWCQYHFIGTTLPESAQDEPVYIHDGQHHDLKAVPSTVRPSTMSFVFWTVAYFVVSIFLTAVARDHNPFPFFILLPLLGIPFFQWYMNVEPVRGTKVALAILTTEVLLHHKHQRDWAKYQATNAKYRP